MTDKLPVRLAADLAVLAEEHRWLIQDLWAAQAVGVVGGEPKCCKSFLALDMAVAVASGKPCLRRFPVADPGPVLLYAAEDALHVVRRRLDGIAAAAGIALAGLPVHVIIARSLRLDDEDDRARLQLTVDAIRPKLLILDPFVRPPPNRRERLRRRCPTPRLSARPATPRPRRRLHRPSRQERCRPHPRRPGTPRILRISRMG